MTRRVSMFARLAATTALGVLLAQAAHAQVMAQAVRHDIRIEPKPIAAALKDLAAQTGLQVLVFSDDAGATRAPGINGNLTTDEALTQLLRDTGLTFHKVDDKTVAIRSKNALVGVNTGEATHD